MYCIILKLVGVMSSNAEAGSGNTPVEAEVYFVLLHSSILEGICMMMKTSPSYLTPKLAISQG